MVFRRSLFWFLLALTLVLFTGWWIQRDPTQELAAPQEQRSPEAPTHPPEAAGTEPFEEKERAPDPSPEGQVPPARAEEPNGNHSHIIRSREGFAAAPITRLGEDFQQGRLDSFTLPLFEQDDPGEIVIQIQNYQENPRFGGGVLRGTVPGYPGSLVSLSQVGDAEAGSIHLPSLGKIYEIRPGPDGTTLFSAIDARELGECLLCLEAADSSPPKHPQPQPIPAPSSP